MTIRLAERALAEPALQSQRAFHPHDGAARPACTSCITRSPGKRTTALRRRASTMGLVRIFDGHMMTLDELYLTPAKIPARFERLSERLGHSFSLPEAKRAMEAARNEGGDSPRRCH